ncbi:hypothetical protein BGW38_005400, partial [Lunasporangiospora selenospora]
NEGSSDVGRSAFDDVPDISHDYTWTSLFGGTERVNADGSVEAKSLQLNAEDVESWIEAKALEEGVKYKLKDTRPSQNTKDSFLKSVRYVCHRAGTYESRSRGRRPSEVQIARESDEMVTASSSSSQFDPNESLAPQKRRPASNPVPFVKRPRPNQKESGKVACRASILIKYFKNNEMVEILHRPMHSNHGSECPVRLCHISKERKARILALLNAGLSRRMIAKRFSHDVTPEYIRKNGIQAARDNSITRLDVYNIDYERRQKIVQLDKDPLVSLKEWGKRLRAQHFSIFEYVETEDGNWSYAGCFGDTIVGVEHGNAGRISTSGKFAFGFMSPWQRTMLQQFGAGISLDSTHGTTKDSSELFTAMVAHSTGKGIPAAFLLTNDKSGWLTHIRKHLMRTDKDGAEYCLLKTIVIDDSQTEKNAINKAFGPDICIHLCLWHVQRNWSRQLQSKVSKNDDSVTIKVVRHAVMGTLRAIMYESDLTKALEKRDALCSSLAKIPSCTEMLVYLQDYYFTPDKEREWMRSYRQDIYWADVNTNNYVESWHNNLKSHFVKYNRHPRHDTLVYILVHDALSLCASDIYKTQLNLGKQTKSERESRKRLQQVRMLFKGKSLVETLAYFQYSADGRQLWVKSMSRQTSAKRYEIFLDSSTSPPIITGCSCPDFLRRLLPCQHLFATLYQFPNMQLPDNNSFHSSVPNILQLNQELVQDADPLTFDDQNVDNDASPEVISPTMTQKNMRAELLELLEEIRKQIYDKDISGCDCNEFYESLKQTRDKGASLLDNTYAERTRQPRF